MIELSSGLSFVAYRYEGGPLRFTVTFPYLKREHVRVLVGDPASPRTAATTWINSTTVEIPSQGDVLPVPYQVWLRRITPFDAQIIEFQDGAMLPAQQLNIALRQLLYAHQELREFLEGKYGVPGTGNPPGGGGTFPDIQVIIDQVIQSPAYQILQQRIPLVDANAELIMADILRSHHFFDVNREYGDKLSTAETKLTLIESDVEVIATQYTDLFARIQNAENDIAARYFELNQAIVNETSARATALTELHAQFETELGGVSAALLQRIDETYADAALAWAAADVQLGAQLSESLLAQMASKIEARVSPLESSFTSLQTTVVQHGQSIAATQESLQTTATAAGANTTWRQQFASQFGPSGATGNSVASAVKTEINTKATPSEAQAIANTSVTAFANGTFAALQQSYNAYVNSNNGRWETTWALRVNGGDINNPVIAGIALSANPNGSDFVVMSDRFAIVTPTGAYPSRKFPFVVGTVGGLSTVGITGQLLVDGSVTADKIKANSLSAITANAGTINGGTFKTLTLDANGEVVNALEFRAELSNVGTWPVWVGAGVKNENNAVFWVDRLGNAGFKGRVSAPNIVGQFQAATAITWSGAVTLPYREANSGGAPLKPLPEFVQICTFTLQPPLLVGESHTPSLSLAISHDALPSAEFILEELRASVWTEIARVGGGNIESGYGRHTGEQYAWIKTVSSLYTTQSVLIATGQPTLSERQFRVRGRYDSGYWNDQNGYLNALGETVQPDKHCARAVNGFVFGIR